MLRSSRPTGIGFAILAAAIGTLAIAGPALAVAPGWTLPVQAYQARFVPRHSFVLDNLGFAHIIAEGGAADGVWYSTNAPAGVWTSIQLTHGLDVEPSIDIENGHLYIAFVRIDRNTSVSKGIWTATDATGPWVVVKRHGGNDREPSLQMHNGKYHIAFRGASHTLRYLTNASGSWVTQIVDGTCCTGGPSLRLTPAGLARVAYPDGVSGAPNGLKLASRNGVGSWSYSTVDTHRVDAVALAERPDTYPRVAYVRHGVGTYRAVLISGTWTRTLLGPGYAARPDITFQGGHIVVVMGNSQQIRVADSNGTSTTSYALVQTGMDADPEVERFGGGLQVIFNRASGTTNDGVFFTKQL